MKGNQTILLAHGSGGKLMHQLIEELLVPALENPFLKQMTDSAVVTVNGVRLAFTTDSYVVRPPFFPGGDIGKLAVTGTVNDLAVVGAKPLFISCGLILEEGLNISELERIIHSMQHAAEKAGVQVVTGDTKVVERGKGDKIFINTAGIGLVPEGRELSVKRIEAGDAVIVSGTLGEHGIAVLSAREGFQLETCIESDCAPLNGLIETLLERCDGVKFLRDPTRGGLASTLNEIAMKTGLGIVIYEDRLPIKEEVMVICELLGFDPLYVANEGKVVVIVAAEKAEEAVAVMRSHPLGKEACIIGQVTEEPKGKVYMKTQIGGSRIVDMLTGDQLPRIC